MSSLAKKILTYNIFSVVNSAIPFLIIPILTNYMSPTDFGIVTIATTTLAIITIVIGLNLHYTVTTYFYKISPKELNKYIAGSIFIATINLLFYILVTLFVGNYIAKYIELDKSVLFIILLIAFLQSITNIAMTLLQVQHRVYVFNFLMIGGTIVGAAFSLVLVIAFELGWQGRIAGIVISTACTAIFGFYLIWKQFVKSSHQINLSLISSIVLKDSLSIGTPLVLFSFSGLTMCFIDRYIITIFVGAADLGIYTVAYSIGMITSTYATSVNRAMFPHICKVMSENSIFMQQQLVVTLYGIFLSIGAVSLLLVILSPLLFRHFIGSSFAEAAKLVPWISSAYALEGISTMLGGFYIHAKRTKILTSITGIAAAFNITATYLAVKYNGVEGAAQATFFTYLILFAMTLYFISRFTSLKWTRILILNKSKNH